MKLDGATVLVTGAGGFIGASTVAALLEEGASARAIDVNHACVSELGDCELIVADVRGEVALTALGAFAAHAI
jgi:nucleoside-diphosphate-sugar epimerase